MNRRDFFTLRSVDTAEVSCERLFVHYRDAVNAGDGAAFLSRAAAEFAKSRKLVFKDSYWLDEHKLAAALAPVLAEFRAHGGMVDLR